MSKEIPLTQGKVAIVDDDDYEWLSQWKWCAVKYHNNWYATRGEVRNHVHKSILMHRQILGLNSGNPFVTDHKNLNGLDNQRRNLRCCTHKQNHQNRRPLKGTTSKYKGVSWHKDNKKWRAEIKINGKKNHLGYFKNEIEAAIIYNQSASQLFGEFAYLNDVK